ncbi:TetR/AcrR family transcriptional regulator [Desertivirga arenae]|uniref:TetR/AcrR family transcriptional regulator n=1 Tax=Desertivirga arenae TaxID=2810309 RepID=UPI001A96E0AD
MIEAADKKREQILDKALTRFAHFGINKTTMNEIADDLAISKPSLYYYFPDKISLAVAVAGKIFDEFFRRLNSIKENAGSTKNALFAIIELRKEYFEKYYMLHLTESTTELNINNESFRKLMEESREKEKTSIQEVFTKDESLSQFPAEPIADLYLDSIMGLGMFLMAKQTKQLLPETKGLEEVIAKQKALTEIFLDGLANRA